MGIEGSIGCGRFKSAIEDVVEEEREISAARLYVYVIASSQVSSAQYQKR